MAFSQTDLTTIEAAIAKGELRVMLDGKSVEYRSIADLMIVRDVMRAELSPATTTTERTSYARFNS